jgi:hypothetical protein
MGYELESPRAPLRLLAEDPDAAGWLEQRWLRANERLAEALADYAALRGRAQPGEPAWIAAQLRIAEARRRCRALADDVAYLSTPAERAEFRR